MRTFIYIGIYLGKLRATNKLFYPENPKNSLPFASVAMFLNGIYKNTGIVIHDKIYTGMNWECSPSF